MQRVEKEYRSILGLLNYYARDSRPDIAYAASWLARFATKITEKKWALLKRVAVYTIKTQFVTEFRRSPATRPARVDV